MADAERSGPEDGNHVRKMWLKLHPDRVPVELAPIVAHLREQRRRNGR